MEILIGILIGVVVWLIVGAIVQRSSAPPVAVSTAGSCADCVRLDAWWASLGWFEKCLAGLWYGTQKLFCVIRGC